MHTIPPYMYRASEPVCVTQETHDHNYFRTQSVVKKVDPVYILSHACLVHVPVHKFLLTLGNLQRFTSSLAAIENHRCRTKSIWLQLCGLVPEDQGQTRARRLFMPLRSLVPRRDEATQPKNGRNGSYYGSASVQKWPQ